jgi:hypothetical protein
MNKNKKNGNYPKHQSGEKSKKSKKQFINCFYTRMYHTLEEFKEKQSESKKEKIVLQPQVEEPITSFEPISPIVILPPRLLDEDDDE